MAIIGTFKATENGFTGTIETLTLKAEVDFEPVERKSSEKAPDFRIFTKKSGFEIGAAWEGHTCPHQPVESNRIDGPFSGQDAV